MTDLPQREPRGRRALHARVLAGLTVGAGLGIASNVLWSGSTELESFVTWVADPLGQIFLRLLFMVVVPLVVTSLILGVAGLGDVRSLGRIGGRALAFFLLTTTLAAVLGLAAVNLVGPGLALAPEARAELLSTYGGQAATAVERSRTAFGVNTFLAIIPRNPLDAAARGEILPLIFFSLVFGVAITRLSREVADPLLRVVEAIGKAVEVMIGFAMAVAPLGVAGLVFSVTARFGFDVLRSLSLYVAVVLGVLAVHQFIVLGGLARLLTGIPMRLFYRRSRTLMVTAFSTSSSNATLPTTIRTARAGFGVPREIAGFVLPLGATLNMNGTAIFEGITVLFLAQVFGVDLGVGTQAIVVILTVLTSIGASGVPSGSIPLLVVVLETVGVPAEGIGLILGVDRILDMARTVPNVTGDLLAAVVLARFEGGEERASPSGPLADPGGFGEAGTPFPSGPRAEPTSSA